MASLQASIMETIIGLKKFKKRKADYSDSDDQVMHNGNRGQKLKKRAKFVHEGQLAPPSGPAVYREIVNHAGYERAIINRNPPLVDDEGFDIDSDDDEERIREAVDRVAPLNPYANVRIEDILAPLTNITDLPTHPTLSKAYTSKTLTDLAIQSRDLMHRENASLWKVKHLQTRLNGDREWAPSGLMFGPNDTDLYRDDFLVTRCGGQSKMPVMPEGGGATAQMPGRAGNTMSGHVPVDGDSESPIADDEVATQANANSTEQRACAAHVRAVTKLGDESRAEWPQNLVPEGMVEGGSQRQGRLDTDVGETSLLERERKPVEQNGGSTTTRSKHKVATVNGASRHGGQAATGPSEPEEENFIHPLFLVPRSARPDRDLGLPEDKAENLRRLLQLWVHKQEEVCRGAKRLYEGLLRADRQRKTVLEWAKHEAHVGTNRDMSDGEDWYDKEEWSLEEDLKKGQDEEEEDTEKPAKKTRARR